jgi:hypothetical protein
MMMTTVIQTEKAEVMKYLVWAMCYYKDKNEILIVPYNVMSPYNFNEARSGLVL